MCGWKFILWDKFGKGENQKELDYKTFGTSIRISFYDFVEVSWPGNKMAQDAFWQPIFSRNFLMVITADLRSNFPFLCFDVEIQF